MAHKHTHTHKQKIDTFRHTHMSFFFFFTTKHVTTQDTHKVCTPRGCCCCENTFRFTHTHAKFFTPQLALLFFELFFAQHIPHFTTHHLQCSFLQKNCYVFYALNTVIKVQKVIKNDCTCQKHLIAKNFHTILFSFCTKVLISQRYEKWESPKKYRFFHETKNIWSTRYA